MNTITTLDRASLRLLDQEIAKALQVVAEQHGLSIAIKPGTFSSNFATLKVEIQTKNSNGEVNSKERQDYLLYASLEGLKPEWLGKQFRLDGRFYTVTGYVPRRHKMPINAKRDDGKEFKFTSNQIKVAFAA